MREIAEALSPPVSQGPVFAELTSARIPTVVMASIARACDAVSVR